MDIVEATNEFLDWELLQTNSDSDQGNSFDEIDSGGLIQANYFSLEAENRYGEHVIDGGSVVSEKLCRIDPGFVEDPARLSNKEPGEFWPDSSSERSEDRKFSELEEGGGLGFRQSEEKDVKFEMIAGKGEEEEELENYCMDSGGIAGNSAEISDLGENSSEISDLGENSEVGVEDNVNLHFESLVIGEEMSEKEGIGSGSGVIDGAESKSGGELEKKGIVWWKMPIEFLKYCMVRMSPVWTVSVAAAFMGFLIFGRRLYKMKRKNRGLDIKVAVDDKKASQVMSRAARLNEVFSVVKLVPVIRPSLPAIGSTGNLTVLSLR